MPDEREQINMDLVRIIADYVAQPEPAWFLLPTPLRGILQSVSVDPSMEPGEWRLVPHGEPPAIGVVSLEEAAENLRKQRELCGEPAPKEGEIPWPPEPYPFHD